MPDSVCKLIEELVRPIENIEQNMAALRGENDLFKEQVARTSANSSQPPSKNPLDFKPNRKEILGKKRGAQIGHKRNAVNVGRKSKKATVKYIAIK